jgi:imidazolonepropionase
MQATRAAGAHELYQTGRARLMAMCRMGITAVEGKSGYGLDRDTELGLLRTMRRLGHDLPLTLRTTYLGAHAVPPEYAGHGDAYVAFMCQAVLPVIQAEGLADFCDAFCETGVFTVPQSAKLLRAAAARGMQLKLHADEMSSTGGAGLAVRLGAVSADHLLSVSAADIEALARSETVAVLLPATAFCMRKPFAPARTMIAAGCAVALASDFNPGSCYTYSLPLVLALAVMAMKMTLPEALTAVTLNAAAAIGAADRLGSIEPGKQADLVLLAEPDYRFLVYETGINIVGHVIQDGKLVF